ncbi:unnamed protein product, partial [Mesorhabditis spiculigera]
MRLLCLLLLVPAIVFADTAVNCGDCLKVLGRFRPTVADVKTLDLRTTRKWFMANCQVGSLVEEAHEGLPHMEEDYCALMFEQNKLTIELAMKTMIAGKTDEEICEKVRCVSGPSLRR